MSAVLEARTSPNDDVDLLDIAARLRRLREASQKRRYRGPPPPLPSRELVIEAVDMLVTALYPRHFGPNDFRAAYVDDYVVRVLESALPPLERQIELERSLRREWKGDGGILSQPRAAEIVREFAASLPRVRAAVDSDLRAAYAGDPSAGSIDEIVFCFPGFAAIIRHRLAHELYRRGAKLIARIISEQAHSETGTMW